MSTLADALGDSSVVVKRNVIKILRVPEILVFTMVQPIMFGYFFE